MDFGGFILFGLLAAFTLSRLFFTLISFAERHPKRMARLATLGASSVLLVIFSLFLYKAYYLDENLVIAAMNGDARQAQTLLSHGADPNSVWEDGKSALQEAREHKRKDIVVMLMKAGAREYKPPSSVSN